VTRLVHENVGWELAPDFEPLLKLVLAAPGRVIKESAAKLVSEHRVAGGSFFIKHYRHAAVPGRTFKFWFKPSQARGEWRLAQALEARGVPIVRHVALGERRSWRGVEESILITEAFDGVPANEVPTLPPEAIPAFIERIWQAGVVQRDLHPANLLVNPATREMRLVDLHGIVVRESPRASDRDLMLATARMALELPVSREVECLSLALRKDALRHRSKRCLKTNRDFARKTFGAWKWNVRLRTLTPEVEQILREPDKFIESARSLKRGRSSTVSAGRGIVLKRYNFKKPLNLVKDLWRGSRGRRGFRKGYHLELAEIATARVFATTDHRVCGFLTRSYVLMDEIPRAVDAGQWSGDPRPAARALGKLIGRLHHEGFTHRDLKETNLLFNPDGVPHLIDLDGLEFVSEVSAEEASANLRRLAEGSGTAGKLNRANVLAFLLTYCRARQTTPRRIFPRPSVRA